MSSSEGSETWYPSGRTYTCNRVKMFVKECVMESHYLCRLEMNKHMVVFVNRMRIRMGRFPSSLEILSTYEATIGIDV